MREDIFQFEFDIFLLLYGNYFFQNDHFRHYYNYLVIVIKIQVDKIFHDNISYVAGGGGGGRLPN